MTMIPSRRRTMRARLMVLALAPLLVAVLLWCQRAAAEVHRRADTAALRGSARTVIALGRLESLIGQESPLISGTAASYEMHMDAGAMSGFDMEEAGSLIQSQAVSLQPDALRLVRSRLGDGTAGALGQALSTRTTWLLDVQAGRMTSDGVVAGYATLIDQLRSVRERAQEQVRSLTRRTSTSAALDQALQAADDMIAWTATNSTLGEDLMGFVSGLGSTDTMKSEIGRAYLDNADLTTRLQATPYVGGTALAAGSELLEIWTKARDDLLAQAGLTSATPAKAGASTSAGLAGAYGRATSVLVQEAQNVFSAIDRATVDSADDLIADVTRSLEILVVTMIAVTILIASWVVLAARSLTRPLAVLGRRATEVSAGRLDGKPVGDIGPKEMADVGAALDAMCGHLRLVEEQTDALALGRLDDPSLARQIPGPLGESIRKSISRVSELTERLGQQARRDTLTGLPNRPAVIEHLSGALHRASRAKTVLAVLFVDLDGFKGVNDAYGHGLGDTVLIEVARRFRAVVRAGEIVGRLGGDEFLVIAEGLNSAGGAMKLGRRLIAATEETFEVDSAGFNLSASVGVAIAQTDSEAMELLREADQAVYQAKREGKGKVRMFDLTLHERLVARATLERELRTGVSRNELVLYYQPVVNAITGATVGAEALVRWNRPGHGVVLPGEFISVAEESWLIVEIGRFVLDQACRQLAIWHREGRDLTMSVNIARRHLAEADVVGDVREALARHAVPPGKLSVELTESHLVTDLHRAGEVLGRLRSIGVGVTLDSFGTGYSSIDYLRQLPISAMKIDKSYVDGVGTTVRAGALMTSLMALADSFGLDVIASGVERPDQMSELRVIGCSSLQGFLYGRPMTPAAFEGWLDARQTGADRFEGVAPDVLPAAPRP